MTKHHFPKIPKIELKGFYSYKTKTFDPKNLKPSYNPREHYKWHEEQTNKHNNGHSCAKDPKKAELHRLALNYHIEAEMWHSINFYYMVAGNFKNSTTAFGKKEYEIRLKKAECLDSTFACMRHNK